MRNHPKSPPRLNRIAALLCWPILAGGPLPALAQDGAAAATVVLDLPAQPLDQAVTELARKTGLVIGGDAALLKSRQAPALQGSYTPAEALRALLAESGISARFSDERSVVLEAAPKAKDGALLLDPVRVEGSVAAAAASGTPHYGGAGSVDTLNRKQLDRFPTSSTGDIFKDIPGVFTAANRNGPSISANIRGAQGMGRVKILVDGTQSTSNDYKGYAGDHDHNYVDPELLGAVTVEKGPNAGPYGAGAIGGVISMRTLEAGDLLREGQDHGLRLRGVYGNNVNKDGEGFKDTSGNPVDTVVPGRNWSGSLAGAWRMSDKTELVAAYAKRMSGNYFAGERGQAKAQYHQGDQVTDWYLSKYNPGDEIFNTSQDTESLLLKAKWFLPQDQRFELGYSEYDSEYGEVRSAAYAWYMMQQPLSSTRKKTLTGRYAWEPLDSKWWNLRANIWAVESDEIRATNPQSGNTDNKSQGLEAWNTTSFDLAWAGIDLKYGGSYFLEKVDVKAPTVYLDPDGERQMTGLFTQVDTQLGNWVVLHGGLRYDRYSAEGQGSYTSPVPGQSPVPFELEHSDSRVNPSAGLTLTPWQGHDLQVFARYSRGWRPPTIKESITNYVNTQKFIKPETAVSTEAGVSFSTSSLLTAQDQFKVRATWFSSDYEDYVIGFAGSFSNVDGAKFEGYELSLDYDLGWMFASYAITYYDKVEYCGLNANINPNEGCSNTQIAYGFGDDNIGVFAPPKTAENATLGFRAFGRRLTFGGRMTSAGERHLRTVDGNTGWYMSRSHWAPYEIYDLFGSLRIGSKLEAGFAIENLRDRFYLDTGSNTLLAIPSPGRTSRLTLTYSF